MTIFDFSAFPELQTERLRLRQITATDAGAWLEIYSHPEVMRYLIDFDEDTTTLDEIRSIIQWTQDVFRGKSGIRWAITEAPDTKMIGSCGFHLYDPKNRCAEIGYELHPTYWRRGIMHEAVTAILQFGYAQLNLHRIEANVTVGNEASVAVLKRLGFSLEGTWRDKVYSRGQFHSLWQFGLLAHEG